MLKLCLQEKLLSFLFRCVRRHYANQLLDGGAVLSGAYAGMKLPEKSDFANFSYAQIVGTYELFIQMLIREVIEKFDRFIDMGCGCGYHTNGVAVKHRVPTEGFDINESEVAFAAKVAQLNGVESVATHQKRLAAQQDLRNGALHLIDIEGGEWELFNNIKSSDYERAGFIIELHKTNGKSIAQLQDFLKGLFNKTHRVRFVGEAPLIVDQDVYDKIKDRGIPRRFAFMLLNEMRDYYQTWAVITPWPASVNAA